MPSDYQKGIKISDEQMKQLSLEEVAFRPQWNYTILPRANLAYLVE